MRNGVRRMIEVRDLTYAYKTGREVLHGITFSVRSGEIFGFLGPNGSGKSTTQKILTGVLKGFGGEVRLLGQDMSVPCPRDFFQEIGVLFEFPYLYTNLSVLDNLRYFSSFYPKERRRNPRELLEKLEFKKEFLNKPVSTYSKGMRQRASMARALITGPRLLFLDEPTSGLDPAGAVLFRQIIQEERERGTTVFLTTHNMSDADLLCDRVAFLSEGRIAALDTPRRLREQNGSRRVQIHYLHQGQPAEKILSIEELVTGLPLPCGEILSIHSLEPTLEDVFIRYTGRGLS